MWFSLKPLIMPLEEGVTQLILCSSEMEPLLRLNKCDLMQRCLYIMETLRCLVFYNRRDILHLPQTPFPGIFISSSLPL